MFELVNKIEVINPDLLSKPIEKWDSMRFSKVQPFITKHFWQDSASINIFRVIGTQHPDYAGMTWIEFLKKG